MSGAQTAERVSIGDPFAMSFDAEPQAGHMVPVPAGAAVVGRATDTAMADVFTAQRVAIKRNLPAILQEARALAAASGPKFFYSIPFKDRRTNSTTYVEGPTIGCAMAAVSIYGNCRVEAFPAEDKATHWTFVARFVDYEKGLTVMRSFQQRKGQDTGMKDGGRAQDMVFQIGQSKAIRNVVVAAVGWLTEEMEAAAKSGILDKIGRDPDKFRAELVRRLEMLDIDVSRVTRVVGRPVEKWLAPDMAKLFAQVSAIKDGMADPDDVFPTSAAEAEELREAGGSAPEQRPEAEKPKPQRQASARKPAPKPEPEPEPAQHQDPEAGPSNEERVAEETQAEHDARAERDAGRVPDEEAGFGEGLNFQ